MKKTSAITLTLLSAAAMAACGGGNRKDRVVAGYRDPYDTTRTSAMPRTGYVPFYRVMNPARRVGPYTVGGRTGGKVGGVSRGGFGGTGAGRGAGS